MIVFGGFWATNMNAIGFAIKVGISLVSVIAATVAAIPGVGFRQFETLTVAITIALLLFLVFLFVMMSSKWQIACAKGMLILSVVLAANFAVDVYDVYFTTNDVLVAEEKKLQLLSVMFLFGSFIMALVGGLMAVLGNEKFAFGAIERANKLKIPKF